MKRRLEFISLRLALPLLAGLAFLPTGGCSTVEVDPFLEPDRYFTVYGAFDMDFLTQYLRVIPIDQKIGVTDEELDATATTTDMSTGQIWTWRDSVFVFTDGSTGHVFTTRFRVQAGRTYRTEVVRSDGAMTWAETTVPSQPHAVMGAASITRAPNRALPIGTQDIVWEGLAAEPYRVHVAYRFVERDDEPFIDLVVPYDTENSSTDTSESWQITVDYTKDYALLQKEYLSNNPGWRFVGALMRVHVLTADWMPPGGVWDKDVLSQPGTFSNVHDGFGYIGSSGRFAVEWIP